MAFTGTAVIQQISDGLVRITGLSLAAAAAGTIGLAGGAGEESLPASFDPKPYARSQTGGTGTLLTVDLAEAIEVGISADTAVTVAPAIQVVKAASPFLITLTNGGGAASGGLEIYIRFN